jgi:hypothetical protein
MAVFKCEKCGATKEGRCKPKKCPECIEAGTMQKKEEKNLPAAVAPPKINFHLYCPCHINLAGASLCFQRKFPLPKNQKQPDIFKNASTTRWTTVISPLNITDVNYLTSTDFPYTFLGL